MDKHVLLADMREENADAAAEVIYKTTRTGEPERGSVISQKKSGDIDYENN
jgi:hypothetical protein